MPTSPAASRRTFLLRTGLGLLAGALPLPLAWGQSAARPGGGSAAAGAPVTAAEALRQLQEGNLRFQKGQLQHPNETLQRRRDIAQKQMPLAAILACSDSRDAP